METGLMLTGLAAGAISALFGMGGGIVIVPTLLLLKGLEMHRAVGTSLAAMLPIIAIALLRHSGYGNVEWKMALYLTAGGVVGALAGAALANALPALALKRLFGFLLAVIALRLMFGMEG